MEWRITAARPGEWHVLGFRVEDLIVPQAMWPSFFAGISANRYPEVIEAAVQEVGAGADAIGVTFPGDLDKFDLTARTPIPADAVEIYCQSFPPELLPRAIFYQVLLAVGTHLLECPGQPAEWYAALRVALQKLRIKIDQDLGG